jgi:diguanylate cyclase (GGDEF)-like protein/PAS domain S-box-containing protein
MGNVAPGLNVVVLLNVLLLEDRDEDALLVERALRGAGYAYSLRRARNRAEFAAQLDSTLDLVLADFHLPDFDALGALDHLEERGLDIPLILVSGEAREEEVLAAVRRGAADFLSKDRLARLGAAIRTVLEQRALRRQAREIQQALERNREEFDYAFENAALGIALASPDGRWLRVNPAFERLTGYTQAELHAQDCHRITYPEDVPGDIELQQKLLAGESSVAQREKRFVHKLGHVVWVQVTVSLVRDRAGRPRYCMLQVLDVTPRKEVEERLQALFTQAAVGIAHTTADGTILEANGKLAEILGYPSLALRGMTTRELTHPEDRDRQNALRLELLAGARRSFSGEKRCVRADGRVIWVHRTVTLARQAASGAPYLIQVFEDITERKLAEERVKRLTRARRVIAECHHAQLHASDEQELLARVCHIMVESGGYKLAWVGVVTGDSAVPVRPVAHAGYGDDAPMTGAAAWSADGRYTGFVREVIATGKPHIARDILNDPAHAKRRARALRHGFQSSIALPLKNGSALLGAIALYASEPDAFDEEELALLAELADDIAFGMASLRERAARRAAEASLRASEERLRVLFEQAAVGITRASLDGVLLEVNSKYAQMLGYTNEELRGRAVVELTHPEDRAQTLKERARLLSGEIASAQSEKRLLRKDGSAIWVNRAVSLARDDSGSPLYLISVIEDITARKEAERRFQETFEQAAVGIVHVDLQNRYLRVNRRFCGITGYSEDELTGRPASLVTHPEDRTKGDEERKALFQGTIASFAQEKRYVRKDGSVIWVNRTESLARDETGQPLYFIRVIEDISERKRMEEALERERSLLRTIVDTLPDYIFVKDREGRFILANEPWLKMRGLRSEEAIGKTVHEIFPREMAERMAAQDVEVVATGVPLLDHETTVVSKNAASGGSELRRSLISKVPLRDAAGAIVGTVGIARDITERRRAEQALRESEERLRAIFEQAGVGIALRDIDPYRPRWLRVNQKLADIFGYSCEELLELTLLDLTPPEERGQAIELNERFARGELTRYSREKRYVRKDGRAIWASVSLAAVRGADGRPAGVVLVIQDVTERVLTERRRAMQNAVTNVLAESPTVEEAMPQLIRAMCEAMDWVYGARWVWNDRKQKLVRAEYWCEFEPRFEEADREHWLELGLDGRFGLVRRTWLESETTWVADIGQQRDFLRRASCAKLGWRSAYAFPIFSGSEVIGVMEFFGREARGPEEALPQVTRNIGNQIGLFIQRRQVEEALRRSEERYRSMFEASPLPMWLWDDETLRFLAVNEAAIAHYGYSRDEFLRMTVRDIWAPDCDPVRYESELGNRAHEQNLVLVRRHRTRNGAVIEVEVTARRLLHEDRTVWLSLANDVTERRRAEAALRESEEQFRQLANNIPQVFWIADTLQKRTLYLSPAAETLLGRPLEQLLARPRLLVRAVHPQDRARVHAARKSAAAGDYDLTYRIVRPDGTIRWVRDRAFPVRDAAGRIYRIAGIAEDVTERRAAEERLLHLAHYDLLTNLPNRVLFYDRLKQALAQARRNQWIVGVVFIDVDRFKNVNDTLGHAIGDKLLQQVSERLVRAVRAGDTVGRLGGDEFAIVLTHLASAQDASLVAQKIMASFSAPFPLEGAEIYVTASLGITLYPDDSTDQDTLIRNADTAMYRAKEAGRNSYQFYTPEMNVRALEILGIESGLRRALEREEFLLYYQPKASLAEGDIVGVEALLRWRHPERGMVAPGEFMPVLEETGLVVAVGNWVMNSVCAQIKAWEQAGIEPVPVAINLSARQFAARDLGATIEHVIEAHGVDPRLIELEITESSLMANTEEAVKTLERLNQFGVRLSIDDFGTGYSSLAYLKRFPLDSLKIDRSFVSGLTTDADDATITRAVISMAHSLGLKVVAEGVETEAQLAFLYEYGCDEIQGYCFARPMPAAECAAWLRERRRLGRPRRGSDANAPRVLLVDDDEDTLALFQRSLAKDGYRILAARNAHEALALLAEQPVDVVISDQSMPGLPGVEFLQRVKALSPGTVRIMTSGYTDFQAVADAINKGEVFRFLPKDASEERLRADVREALHQRLQGAARDGHPAA